LAARVGRRAIRHAKFSMDDTARQRVMTVANTYLKVFKRRNGGVRMGGGIWPIHRT